MLVRPKGTNLVTTMMMMMRTNNVGQAKRHQPGDDDNDNNDNEHDDDDISPLFICRGTQRSGDSKGKSGQLCVSKLLQLPMRMSPPFSSWSVTATLIDRINPHFMLLTEYRCQSECRLCA